MKSQTFKSFAMDKETLEAIEVLKVNGINLSFTVRKAIQEAANKIKK